MARTKPHLGREDKQAQIVAAARELLLQEGYEGAAMGRIAQRAEVAPNTLYWYFADKDALLIAVLDEVLADALQQYAHKKKASAEAQVSWLVDALYDARHLISTVHARAELSEPVREWHERFHQLLEATVSAQAKALGLDARAAKYAARTATFVLEGLLAHPLDAKERRAFVRWLLRSLLESNAQRS